MNNQIHLDIIQAKTFEQKKTRRTDKKIRKVSDIIALL
jgi:uncharacterized membrane protein